MIRAEDVQTDVVRGALFTPYCIRLTHKPTGCVVEGQGTLPIRLQWKLFQELNVMVEQRLLQH